MKTSFIVPCYNAGSTIRDTIELLRTYLETNDSLFGPWEIIAVNDGSTDGTASILTTLGDEIRVVDMDANRGKGAAVRRGMIEAQGAYRFFVDADAPYDLSTLQTMLRYLDDKEFDLVIGARDLADSLDLVKRSHFRILASFLYTAIVGRLVVTGVRDTQCGMKGFRSEAAQQLFGASIVNGFAFDVEILYLAFKCNYDIKRLPVKLVRNDHSSVSVIRHGLPMLWNVFMLPARYYTGRYPLEPKRWDI